MTALTNQIQAAINARAAQSNNPKPYQLTDTDILVISGFYNLLITAVKNGDFTLDQ